MEHIKKFFTDTIAIFRRTKIKDEFGGIVQDFIKQEWMVPCRIYSKSGNYKIILEGATYKITAKMVCDNSIDIEVGDKIKDNKDNSFIVVNKRVINGINDEIHKEYYLA